MFLYAIQVAQASKNEQQIQALRPGVRIVELLAALPPLPDRAHGVPRYQQKQFSFLFDALVFLNKEISSEQAVHESERSRLQVSGERLQEVVKIPEIANLKSQLQNPELESVREAFNKSILDIHGKIVSELKDRHDSEQELRTFMAVSASQQVAESPVLGEHYQPIQVAIPSTDPSFTDLVSKYDQSWNGFLKAIGSDAEKARTAEISAQGASTSELIPFISHSIRIHELNCIRDAIVARIRLFGRFG